MNNKLKVFISSTSDLKRWRKAVSDTLIKMGFDGNKFEDWPASPNYPLKECLQRVKESDAFILLIKDKYGTIESGISITHHEYRTEKECIPIFVFILPRTNKI